MSQDSSPLPSLHSAPVCLAYMHNAHGELAASHAALQETVLKWARTMEKLKQDNSFMAHRQGELECNVFHAAEGLDKVSALLKGYTGEEIESAEKKKRRREVSTLFRPTPFRATTSLLKTQFKSLVLDQVGTQSSYYNICLPKTDAPVIYKPPISAISI